MVSAARSGMPTGTGVSDTNTGGPWFGHSSTKYSWQDSQTAGARGEGVRSGRRDARTGSCSSQDTQRSGQHTPAPRPPLAQPSPFPNASTHADASLAAPWFPHMSFNKGFAPNHTCLTNTSACVSPRCPTQICHPRLQSTGKGDKRLGAPCTSPVSRNVL